jgi:hypothetical protein
MASETKMPASVAALATYLGDLADRMAGDAGWEEDLSPSEKQFVTDLGNVVIHTLDPDILGIYLFDDNDEGRRIAKAVKHQHNCG